MFHVYKGVKSHPCSPSVISLSGHLDIKLPGGLSGDGLEKWGDGEPKDRLYIRTKAKSCGLLDL